MEILYKPYCFDYRTADLNYLIILKSTQIWPFAAVEFMNKAVLKIVGKKSRNQLLYILLISNLKKSSLDDVKQFISLILSNQYFSKSFYFEE